MRAQEGLEELFHVQGEEQRLHFAGAAVKRYPTSKVPFLVAHTVKSLPAVQETWVRFLGQENPLAEG